ncbi:MAG: Co2+/Mg2+ efflux protein ApaG [Idiomarina sp.]|nr:Co2+/Mg2+ efflux protein ApaG [Idiomarina sp.]
MSDYNIALSIKTQYLESQSDPDKEQFVFAYTITITNQSHDQVQLLTREWHITDADGKVTHVTGEGVVGQQPLIAPGDSFSYTSGAVLKTPVGSMEGTYGMISSAGNPLDVPIPLFRLAVPNILH